MKAFNIIHGDQKAKDEENLLFSVVDNNHDRGSEDECVMGENQRKRQEIFRWIVGEIKAHDNENDYDKTFALYLQPDVPEYGRK